MHDISADRTDYSGDLLDEEAVAADPLGVFARWLEDAYGAGNPEPTAMQLATLAEDDDGLLRPRVRTVLLKGVNEGRFEFYTNGESAKGRELAAHPQVALHWYWPAISRAIRVEGRAAPLPRDRAEAYFATRPRGSQLGAWASAQSRPIPSREDLLGAYAAAERRFAGGEVPCPPYWGGWSVTPERIEFWQGEPSRLHDRLECRAAGASWAVRRLAP